MSKRKILLITLVLFSFLGLLISLYSTWAHFDSSKYNFCTFGSSFDCDKVNSSKYATLLGIPVAAIGAFSYFCFILFSAIYWKYKNQILMTLAGTLAIVGLLFSLYLTSIEAFVLHSWCVLCIGSQVAILAVFILVMMIKSLDWPKSEEIIKEDLQITQ